MDSEASDDDEDEVDEIERSHNLRLMRLGADLDEMELSDSLSDVSSVGIGRGSDDEDDEDDSDGSDDSMTDDDDDEMLGGSMMLSSAMARPTLRSKLPFDVSTSSALRPPPRSNALSKKTTPSTMPLSSSKPFVWHPTSH